jgi:hypothetical protein
VRAYTAAVERGNPGGRVIVMDLVVGSSPEDAKATEMLLPRDVMMMGWSGAPSGTSAREWFKTFEDAGFSCYKIVALRVWGPTRDRGVPLISSLQKQSIVKSLSVSFHHS